MIAALAACTDRVALTIPFPSIAGAQTEIIRFGDEVHVLRAGEALIFEGSLPESGTFDVAAKLYDRSPEELHLTLGPRALAEPGFPWIGQGFTLDVLGFEAGDWRASEDPRLADYAAKYGIRSLGHGSGEGHLCLVTGDGDLYCMGADEVLDLSPLTRGTRVPLRIAGLGLVEDVALSLRATCAIVAGKVLCFGLNSSRQLGQPASSIASAMPLVVPGVDEAIAIDAHGARTCVIERGGAVTCWGISLLTVTPTSAEPAKVRFPRPIEHIAVGTDALCGIAGGEAWCQGRRPALGYTGSQCNESPGVLPTTEPVPLELPAPIRGHVAEVTLGEFGGCARSEDGAVYCWGCNTNGSVGTGAKRDGELLPPTRVEVPPMLRVEAGGSSVCGITFEHDVYCWGSNDQGQLARVDFDSIAPMAMPISDVVDISVQWNNTCLTLASGEIRCVGRYDCGQLGAGRFPGDLPGATCNQAPPGERRGAHTKLETVVL